MEHTISLEVNPNTTILIGHCIARTPDDSVTIIGSGRTLRFNIKTPTGTKSVDVDLSELASAAMKVASADAGN